MKYQIKNEKLILTETNSNDYTNLINILYGLNTSLSFKDNNKYNLSKDNVIVNDFDTS
jgi:hypothetical protein